MYNKQRPKSLKNTALTGNKLRIIYAAIVVIFDQVKVAVLHTIVVPYKLYTNFTIGSYGSGTLWNFTDFTFIVWTRCLHCSC